MSDEPNPTTSDATAAQPPGLPVSSDAERLFPPGHRDTTVSALGLRDATASALELREATATALRGNAIVPSHPLADDL